MKRAITQTEARARLKALTADLRAPRVIYPKADGREVLSRFSRWQAAADRILTRRRA